MITIIFSFIIAILYFYLFLPVLNYGFFGLPIGIILIFSPIVITESAKRNILFYSSIAFLVLSIFYMSIYSFITTSPLFRAASYRSLIGKVEERQNFSEDVSPVSTEKIRIIDRAVAYRLGDKVLGTRASLGSQTILGNFNIQKVGDQLYWVAPLLHSGFFKWNKNRIGTPGYVMVSAINERDVKLVQKVNGKPIRIKFQENAYFTDNLERHIYIHGYLSRGLTDFTFEIDDTGKPYWVITLFKKKVGFGGEDASGVLLVDTATGSIQEYSIENAPKWVDRIQPEEFIVNQLNDWGEYIHGYWNFSNEGKLTTTTGISLVYGDDNQSYWYTGLTSVGSDEGTVGFILVNTRNKMTKWFRQVGATETAAMTSAMGKVQEKRYQASFPITYNINGVPTYVMSLKDKAGLIKMVSMVSVLDYSIVGVGDNLNECLRSYKNALNSAGNALAPNSKIQRFSITSEIMRISKDISNGNTLYYILLKDFQNKLFVGSSSISPELPISRKGDVVKLTYDEGGNVVVDIATFDNMNIILQKTDAQQEIEKFFYIKKKK
ncbi:MAG: hypothetical protein H7A25_17240 [Leptospiraceae bacterium]|nr:hypothetical protein [Leptospiraceae bacterium]